MARLFQEHRNKIPIEKIVKDILPDEEFYEDSRGELWCRCPFHDDSNPSFSININPTSNKYGLYHCFACGGGNIINMVFQIKGFDSYDESEKWVESNYFNILDDEWDKEELLSRVTEEEPPRKNISGKELPFYEISHANRKHPWMYNQGLVDEAIEHFMITYDDKQDGIIFPHMVNNQIVGWQTRDLTGTKRAKYINTLDFPKGSTLYHLDCKCNEDTDYIIVVESPKTAAIMWGVGYHNVVATFGASITEEQMSLLWDYKNIFLWFDNDEAGAKATLTALNYLKDYCEVYIVPPVEIPKGDPADIPYDEWERYLNKAEYYVHWRKR
jgi:DNA primase